MDFLSKILQRKPAKSGGRGSPAPAATSLVKPDHEAHVEFAREFVVELVESVPKKSEKAALTKLLERGDDVSLKSVSPSEGSFLSVISAAENVSLPDLLQPEFVYKKQTDTDTDTTEYESAPETDPLDATSPVGSLIAEDLLSSFQEALDKKYPGTGKEGIVTESAAALSPVNPVASISTEAINNSSVSSEFDKTFEYKADNSVLQDSESPSVSEAYVCASKTSGEEIEVTPLDISGLCLCVDNLSLDSPRQTEKSNLPLDHKATVYDTDSNSDIPILGIRVDADVSESVEVADGLHDFEGASVGDSTFVLADSSNISSHSFEAEADVVEIPKESPVLLEVAETFDSGLSSVDHTFTTLARNSTSTAGSDEKIEVEFNKIIGLHTDSQQATAESNKIQGEVPFIFGHSKEEASRDCVLHNNENVQICQNIDINEAQEQHVVATEGFKKSDVLERITQIEVEDINSTLVEVDTSTKTSFSSTLPVEETENCLESKFSSDFDSAQISTPLAVLSVNKEASSEFTETAVHQKPEPEAAVSVISPEVPSITAATNADIVAEDQRLPVQKEQEEEFVKEVPTVLSELFEICSRQQKDLELGDEKFVDGTEFFSYPYKRPNLREKVDLHIPHSSIQSEFEKSLLDLPVPVELTEFDQSIADEADKILQEIINSSSEFHKTGVRTSDNRHSSGIKQTDTLNGIEAMADSQSVSKNAVTSVDENGGNPFVSQCSLHRSPPSSPRPSSQRLGPCESPHTKPYINTVKDSFSHDSPSGDTSPHFVSGKSSPDRRICSSKVSSLGDSIKNSISPDMNQSEAGPEIADDAHLHSGDVFKDPAAFEYLSLMGSSHVPSDLRKESLYVKFDPLVGGISITTEKSVPLPSSVETNSSVPAATSPGKEHQCGNTTPVKNPALTVIDKLISLSPSPMKSYQMSPPRQLISPVKESVPLPAKQEPTEIICSETVIGSNGSVMEELHLLRELCAAQDEKYKERVMQLEQEIVTLKGHVQNLQSLVRESEERETKLSKKVAEKAQAQKQMSIIMEEYEKTISRLVAEKEQERQAHELDKSALLKDRDAAMGHLANIEIAFSDLHKKYERSKTVIEGFKKNEEVLRVSLAEYEATIRKQEQKYDVLKSHAMSQLESANQELDSVHRSQQAETAKLKAMLKKAEVKTSSLEEMLEQKVKENQELASICDELINKVGNGE
ncbi:uncharacterized protein LOC110829046 isoform X2 [Zootermopsis nevadensis]|uniref:uncharacterized protein LOC110829046 isoform X2 n=1 Tax=Zootermopsis nevadensis TaxID=136037 RepID=UPI000B8E39C2|nr:uncharacterized protein LOC110829046 isoform X2 [Zootermopsis nevadensis]